MSKGKELAKNTIILFIGVFFTKIIQYFLLPVYTGYLTTEEYGTVDLFNTIISLLIPIIGLQIEQGVFRYLISNRKNRDRQKEYISSSFIFIVLSCIFFAIICFIFNLFINNEYKIIVEFNLFMSLLSTYLMQLSRGLGDNKNYSISTVITSVGTIMFNILFIVGIGLKIDGMLYGSFIGYILGIFYLIVRLKVFDYISIKLVNTKALKEMLSYSLPMIPNTLSWWVFSSSDRFIVSSFIGLSETGLLSIAYKFSNIGIIIYNIFNMSITESISLHIDDEDIDEYFNKIYSTIGQFFISFCSILIAFMPIAFYILINKNYNDAYGLIPIAILATEFQVLVGMLGTVYVAKKNTKNIAITSIVAAIVNIVSDILLIKYIGVYAAVVSTLLSYFVLFVYRFYDVNNRYIKLKTNILMILNFIFNLLTIVLLYYINNFYLNIISIVIAIILSIIFNINNFKHFKRIVFRKDV